MFNIAINTFKEIIRNKYLYMIVFFWIIFILFSILLSKLSIWDTSKIIIDFWLSAIEIFWLVWVLFIWSQLLFKEIEGKTIFLILSKPIKRNDFLTWKFLGFSFVVFLIALVESILFLLMLIFQNIEITNLILWSLVNIFFKLEIVLALVFFFSSFMWSLLTIIVTILLYFLGHSYSIILSIANKTENSFIVYSSKIFWAFIPQFEALNTKDVIWTFSNFTNTFFLWNVLLSLFYIVALIMFTNLIFSKKEFE